MDRDGPDCRRHARCDPSLQFRRNYHRCGVNDDLFEDDGCGVDRNEVGSQVEFVAGGAEQAAPAPFVGHGVREIADAEKDARIFVVVPLRELSGGPTTPAA